MPPKEEQKTIEIEQPAQEGGVPVRRKPLPLEFPGMHYIDNEEIEAAIRVLKSRSLFRYYGIDLQGEVDAFERELPNLSAASTLWRSAAEAVRCRPHFPPSALAPARK